MTPSDPTLDPLHAHIAYFGSAVVVAYLAAVLTSTPAEPARAPVATLGGAAALAAHVGPSELAATSNAGSSRAPTDPAWIAPVELAEPIAATPADCTAYEAATPAVLPAADARVVVCGQPQPPLPTTEVSLAE